MCKPFFSPFSLRVLVACFLLTSLATTPVWPFTLIEPKESSVHSPGEKITIQLDLGEVAGINQVKYFWYGDQEDMLEELVEDKLALVSTKTHEPPFGGTLRVPRTAIGNLRLLAVAEREGGQSGHENWAIFDEVLVHIEPKAKLLEIDFETDKPLRFGRAGSARVYDKLDFLGKIFELPVIGRFSDGVVRPIRLQATGTAYESTDDSVVTVQENGLLRLVGNGHAGIKVTNRGKQALLEVDIEVNDELNEPPVPDPGSNQVVNAGDRVKLNALQSYDPEGGSLEYHWSQVRGSKVPLLDPFSAKASFLAPYVVGEGLFRFKLRVTDTQGADSLPAYVDVIVEP